MKAAGEKAVFFAHKKRRNASKAHNGGVKIAGKAGVTPKRKIRTALAEKRSLKGEIGE